VSLRRSKKVATERDFPHIVEIALPVNGLDVGLSREITTFHRLRNIQPRFGRASNRNNQSYGHYCFSDPANADAFVKRFGGARVMNKP